jgi:hypothetical protein
MSLSAAAAIDKPPRRAVPLKKREAQPRHIGGFLIGKRLREAEESWEGMIKAGLKPEWGSELGQLWIGGHLSTHQAEAGQKFAEFCAFADHYMGTPKRNAASPMYQRGWGNSRNDEEALALLQGNVKDFERRCKRALRRWDRLHGYIIDDKVFSLLLDVCVHNQHCPVLQIPRLRAALELLVIKLGINRIRPEDQPRMQPKKRYRKPKQGDQNDRRRDPSSYYNRDSAPAAAVPEPQGGGSSQD